jgi:hypothetical protein
MAVDKGSVLIAAFGLPPLAHEDDAVRAVEASMELKKVLELLQYISFYLSL